LAVSALAALPALLAAQPALLTTQSALLTTQSALLTTQSALLTAQPALPTTQPALLTTQPALLVAQVSPARAAEAPAAAMPAPSPSSSPSPLGLPTPPVVGSASQIRFGAGWRVATLPGQTLPVTRFSPAWLDGRAAVRMEAVDSYGNLLLNLALPATFTPRELRWSWRVDVPNAGVELAERSGDDSPAKVCLGFDLALERVPFFERNLLRLARTRSTDPLPAATLCWVWGHEEAVGTLLPSPYTQRVRYIVLRGAGDASGQWFDEVRNVAADFRRAFGDESPDMPRVTALLLGADADNTHGRSVAFVADLRLEP